MGESDRMTDPNRPAFDVYAKPFVPQSLKAVNEAPAHILPSAPVRWIDFDRYVQTFTGTDFVASESQQALADERSEGRQSIGNGSVQPGDPHGLANFEEPPVLSPQDYEAFFAAALKQEFEALVLECDEHALFQVPLSKTPPRVDPRPFMYRYETPMPSVFLLDQPADLILMRIVSLPSSPRKRLLKVCPALQVPGLREMSLRIETGDIVQLRQLQFDDRGHVICMTVSVNSTGRVTEAPGHTETQYDAVVWAVNRFNETLSLRIDALLHQSMLFNVTFTVQKRRVGALWMAAMATQSSLRCSRESWLRSILFPEPRDGFWQEFLNSAHIDLQLNDPILNYEQLRAIDTVLNESYGPVPYIISGPPGTGKTKTIVELALQLIAKSDGAHLLLCAPSDPAADTLSQRLAKHLKPSQLLRLNGPGRSFPEVPNNLLAYCCIDDDMFSLPSFADLMRLQIVVVTCRDAEVLLHARLSNASLYELEKRMMNALQPHSDHVPSKFHWTGLLMDEAAQATELETLIPLRVVTPPDGHDVSLGQPPTLVMAGDRHQLGPRTASKATALRTSLFQRLLERPFYADHPLTRSKQRGGIVRPLTQQMLPILRPAFTNLIRNYRSHAAILAIPSAQFYNDTLEPEAADADTLLSLPVWRGRKWPVLFVSHQGPDEIERDGGGWYNLGEARLAGQMARSMVASGEVRSSDICIMSPFRAQVRKLRDLVRASPSDLSGVNIGPLEAFQGLESRVVILCTTRTRDRFVKQDVARGLGVIHEPRRFNVALTRARHGLVVIGNPYILDKDENWLAFLSFCHRNGLWEERSRGDWAPLSDAPSSLSRLENQLLWTDQRQKEIPRGSRDVRNLGAATDEVSELWRSGNALAEQVLREDEDAPDDIPSTKT